MERVLIIGGGIVGLTTAHTLRRRGLDVLVLDAGPDRICPSRGNAGQIAPGHPPIPSPAVPPKALHMMLDRRSPLYIPPRPSLPLLRWLLAFRRACERSRYERNMEVLAHLSRTSRELFDELADELGPAATLEATGLADIWQTEAGEMEAEAETEWINRLGFATECLDGSELRRRDPAWGPEVRGAVIHGDGMRIDPAILCDVMRAKISSLGGLIRTGCVVETIRRYSGGWEAVMSGGEIVIAGRLVLTAGVWSESLARMMGISVAMQPAKGYHRMIRLAGAPTIAAVLREPKVGVTPMGSLLRVAGTLELSGFNHRLDPNRVKQLMAGAQTFLPGIRGAEPVDLWCGLRPCTASGLPVIGRGLEGAWIATGHGMMGVTLAPGTAKLIADDMLGEPVPDWAEMLQPR